VREWVCDDLALFSVDGSEKNVYTKVDSGIDS